MYDGYRQAYNCATDYHKANAKIQDIHPPLPKRRYRRDTRAGDPACRGLRSLGSHPLQIITRWNWKAAPSRAICGHPFISRLSAAKENNESRLTAAGVELGFRFHIRSFRLARASFVRRASPAWLASSSSQYRCPFSAPRSICDPLRPGSVLAGSYRHPSTTRANMFCDLGSSSRHFRRCQPFAMAARGPPSWSGQ